MKEVDKMDNLIIGSHVSFGSSQLLGSVKEALSYGANTFMFYTGAPQNTIRKNIEQDKTEEAIALMNSSGIDLNNVICHAPYIVNLANNKDEIKYNFSITFLKGELTRCEEMGIKYIVLHPGSSVGIDRDVAIENIIYALNQIITADTKCTILLETMAGKGTEIGCTTEEIKKIIDGIKYPDKIGVCLDTCHLNDAGYNLQDFDSYLDEFSSSVGLSKIKCVHINDSKNSLGSNKDRHANIGYGTIGFSTLLHVIYHDKLKDIPKILETPYIGDTDEAKERLYPPYKYEIAMIRNKEFNNNLMIDIRNEYQKKLS